MHYQRFDGETRDYDLEPRHLAAYHGNWYLVARNALAGRLETFALSRCRSFAGTGQYFARPVAFDPQVFFKNAFGISLAERPWKVRLLFAREVATYIGERVWQPGQWMRRRRDGALELRLCLALPARSADTAIRFQTPPQCMRGSGERWRNWWRGFEAGSEIALRFGGYH